MKNELWSFIKDRMLEHPYSTVSEGDAIMTFEELCIFAENYAGKLKASFYGIFCQSEMASAMALLACIAAGKPAIPIPTRYGNDLYRKILDEADPPYVISDITGELDELDMNAKTMVDFSKSPAVILYTSGSTGKPKGVMLSRSNLICNVKDILSYLPIGEKDTFLITRPLYHSSVLTGEFLAALCSGCNIVFYSGSFNPSDILKIIKRKLITAMGSTPTLMSTLARLVRGTTTATVRILTVSGECMTVGMAQSIRTGFPKAKVLCGYGLSEASPRVAFLPHELFNKNPTAAGLTLPSVEIKIVDENGNEVKAGQVGELLVKGDNVMMGYFKNPQKTKETIKDNWLHTNDLAYVKKELLYIKGRKDDMIIRAGMNIYPAEIENVLSTDERVSDLLVYGYFDGTTQQIGLKIKGDFSYIEEVVELCREKLSSYQMPNKIEIVDNVTGSFSGKKKRKV